MTEFAGFKSETEIERLVWGMMACSLPREEWTHGAHFAGALWLMVRRPKMDVVAELPGMIRAYNVSIGGENNDAGGYHETITQASLRGARAFLAGREEDHLHVVCNALMATELGRSDWPLRYWTRERLFSVAARKRWVEPDLKRLPF